MGNTISVCSTNCPHLDEYRCDVGNGCCSTFGRSELVDSSRERMGIWSSFAVAVACTSFLHVGGSDSGFSSRYTKASTCSADDYTNLITDNMTEDNITNANTANDVESRNSMQFGEFPLSKIPTTPGRHNSRSADQLLPQPQTTIEDDRAQAQITEATPMIQPNSPQPILPRSQTGISPTNVRFSNSAVQRHGTR